MYKIIITNVSPFVVVFFLKDTEIESCFRDIGGILWADQVNTFASWTLMSSDSEMFATD